MLPPCQYAFNAACLFGCKARSQMLKHTVRQGQNQDKGQEVSSSTCLHHYLKYLIEGACRDIQRVDTSQSTGLKSHGQKINPSGMQI